MPEQFTFDAEKSMIDRLGGLFGVEVLSFDRLAERILTLSGRHAPYLSGEGLSMIVKRALLLKKDELKAFARVCEKPGFAAEIASYITKLTGAGVSPDALAAAMGKLPTDSLLSEKLFDITLLYRETDAFLKSRFITPDDALNAAAEALPNSFAANAAIFIDGFEGATHAVYTLTKGLFTYARSVTVALTCEEAPGRDAAVFETDFNQYGILRAMANDCRCTVAARVFDGEPAGRSKECAHMEKNLFASPARAFEGRAENIAVFSEANRQLEAEAVAERALAFLAEKNARCGDIAVLCPNLDGYALPLLRAFESRGLPAFVDRREKLLNHHLTRFTLACLGAAANDFSVNDVLTAVKAGFFPLEQGAVEAFENEILRRGLKGSMLNKPFAAEATPPEAETARSYVMERLSNLKTALAARSVFEKVRALYAFLTEQNVTETLVSSAKARRAEGRLSLMQFDTLSYNRIVDLLSQLDAILGSVPMSRADFYRVFEEGLADAEVGLVPQLPDGVLIGEIGRTRTRPAEMLFIVGASDGQLPRGVADDGLIDDNELSLLGEAGLEGLTGTEALYYKDLRATYLSFAKAKTRLTLSYALSFDGAEQLPGALYTKLIEIFPDRGEEKTSLPRSRAGAFSCLADGLRAYEAGEEENVLLPSLLRVLSDGPEKALTEKIRFAAKNDPLLPNLPKKAADALYGGKLTMSASRLERFSACPFSQFAAYGLAARERPLRRERSADIGSLYHAALDAFIKTCQARAVDYSSMTVADADAIIDEVLPGVLATHNDGYFIENERARAELPLIIERIKLSARAIVGHLAAGNFTPAGSELRFGAGCAFPPILLELENGRTIELSGVIDRIDCANGEDGTLLRVVDYKTGGRLFAFAPILHGLNLQLPLYLDAVAAAGGEAAGLYYMQLTSPAPDESAEAEKALNKVFALRGLTLSDPVAVDCTEKNLTGRSSVVQGLRLNKDGAPTGTVCTKKEMRLLLNAAKRIGKQAARRMLQGDISAFPTGTACEYCPYAGCCRFDEALPKCKKKRIDRVPAEEFFRLIGGYGDALDR